MPFRTIQLVADRFRMLQAATAVPHFLASYNFPFDILTVPMTVGLKSFHCGLPFKGNGIHPFGSGLSVGSNSITIYDRCAQVERKFLSRLDKRLNNVRQKWGVTKLFDCKITGHSRQTIRAARLIRTAFHTYNVEKKTYIAL